MRVCLLFARYEYDAALQYGKLFTSWGIHAVNAVFHPSKPLHIYHVYYHPLNQIQSYLVIMIHQ